MFNKVLIIGNGTMGRSLALILKRSNIELVHIGYRDFLKADLNNLLESQELVIEATFEDFQIKSQIYQLLYDTNSNALIGTTTSSLSITDLSLSVSNDFNLIGLHFMNPPTSIKQIEIVSANQIPKKLENLLVYLGFEPIYVPDNPGFALNAILFPMLNSAANLVSNTELSPQIVDDLLKNVCGHKIGPLRTLDLIGIDVATKILENLNRRSPKFHLPPSTVLYKLISDGHLGRKSGKGFYEY